MLETINKDLKEYYGNRRTDFTEESQFVGWKNQQAQWIRFEQLFKLMERDNGFSVNDLGCGMAHFVDFLQEKQKNFQYAGYDMLAEMVDTAAKKYAQVPNTSFQLIEQVQDLKPADYTIASGIFNLRYGMTTENWTQYMLNTLTVMNEKSQKGFAFNALTTYSDPEYMREELHYSDPLFLFDFCKKNFAKDVALLHDYNQYDFTILVRKVVF